MTLKNILTIVLGGILALLVLNVLPAWVTETEQSLVLAFVVVLLLIFVRGGMSTGMPSFSTGSFWMKVVSSALAIGALFWILYEMFPNAPLFNTPEGYGEIATYFVLAFIVATVVANHAGFGRLSLLILLGACFALIGPRTGMLLPGLGEKLHLTGGASSGSIQVWHPGRAQVDTLTSLPLKVNDAGYHLHFGIINGAVELSGPTGSLVVHPGEEPSVPYHFDVRTARAVSGRPVISHTSCSDAQEPRYDGQNCI